MKIIVDGCEYRIRDSLGYVEVINADNDVVTTLQVEFEAIWVTYFCADGSTVQCDLPRGLMCKPVDEVATLQVATHPEI